MGTSQRHIIMVGVNLDGEYGWIGDSKLDWVFDGMNGNYIMIGRIINDGYESEGLEFDSVSLLNLMETFGEVECLLRNELGVEQEVRLFSFTHWY